MSESFFSSSWYRVAEIKPRLRSHVKIHRHHYRGQLWYVLQDQSSGRFHRFTPASHIVISLMNGQRSMQEIWDMACIALDEDAMTQDQLIQLLSQLHRSDVLQGDVLPDTAEMSQRGKSQRWRKLILSLLNPLAVRIPILDPERFLNASYPFIRPFIGWFGAIIYLVLISSGIILATMHWQELTENITDRVLTTENLLYLFLSYPLVKAIHELGHGYVVKHWGGEVHELGVMFLVFIPVPYVDASAAAAFRQKWRRALVGAAGILVELLLATLALFVWLNVEPGPFRAFVFNIMLIGGISTLLFNGNPLLRFDGYYVFSDLIEIPNLGQRANRYIAYLIQRYLFRISKASSPATAKGESTWFVLYGIAAFVYRMFIMAAIILFVASKFFIVGILIAIWSCVMMLGLPLAKQLRYLFFNQALHRRRTHAFAVVASVLAVISIILLVLPMPYRTTAEGVVWMPGNNVVHARTEGAVVDILAKPNSFVQTGDPLIKLQEPFLAAQVRVLQAEVNELEMRYNSLTVEDRVEAKIALQQMQHARARLALSQQRSSDLIVTSPANGIFILPRPTDLAGSFVHKGETLAYVSQFTDSIIKVVVSKDLIDIVRNKTVKVEIRMAEDVSKVIPATIQRIEPAATRVLPSLALSTLGGGKIFMDPREAEVPKALEKMFVLNLHVDSVKDMDKVGGRVYVRFDHGQEALAGRIYRSLRQLFLRQLNV